MLDPLVVEEPAHERLDGAEEVGEGDAAVDGERLDLVEHRRVPGVERLVAVGAAGRDHEDRRLHRLHGADLHRRRVGAQHHLLGLAELDVERVLHRAGGVAGQDVQRLEVVPVVLDLGPLHDAVAHAHEDVLELALHLGDEVEVPAGAAVAAEGEVEAVALPAVAASAAASSARRASASVGDAGGALADGLARGGPVGGVERLDRLVQLRDRASPRPANCRSAAASRLDGVGGGDSAAAASSKYSSGIMRPLRRAPAPEPRCLVDSKHSTVAAIATLSDSAGPAMGWSRGRRGAASSAGPSPWASFPTTTAVGRVKSTSV